MDRRSFGVTLLDRPSRELTELLRFEADRARALLAPGRTLQTSSAAASDVRSDSSPGEASLALEALERAHWDVFTQRPRPSRTRLALAALAR
jgi:hypothetical protein